VVAWDASWSQGLRDGLVGEDAVDVAAYWANGGLGRRWVECGTCGRSVVHVLVDVGVLRPRERSGLVGWRG